MSQDERPSERIDVRERGAPKDGAPQFLDRRLFMQLLAFECGAQAPHKTVRRLGKLLEKDGVASVIYEDVNHPTGFALLTFSENPHDLLIASVLPSPTPTWRTRVFARS